MKSLREVPFSGKYILLLSSLGPFCLLLGLTSLLFKCAQQFWLIAAVAFLGFPLIWKWKKWGFFASLFLLSAVMIAHVRAPDPFWPSFLSLSIALSWLLLFLGHQEALTLSTETETQIAHLNEKNVLLEEELVELKQRGSIQGSTFESLKEQISSLRQRVLQEEEEKRDWKTKHEALLASQILTPTIIPQEEQFLSASFEVLETQYAQLKEQFEEKSEILHQTRKQLFIVEGQLLLLQRQIEEEACGFSSEDASSLDSMQQLIERCEGLEFQVSALEECITALVTPKKKQKSKETVTRRRKKTDEVQEDLFQISI